MLMRKIGWTEAVQEHLVVEVLVTQCIPVVAIAERSTLRLPMERIVSRENSARGWMECLMRIIVKSQALMYDE